MLVSERSGAAMTRDMGPYDNPEVGWTKEEYDRCPELAARLHRRILDLEDECCEHGVHWSGNCMRCRTDDSALRTTLERIADLERKWRRQPYDGQELRRALGLFDA